MNKVKILLVFLIGSLASLAQTKLPIPDTLSGKNISLNIHQDSVRFFDGAYSKTYAFNQYSYLGPTLLLKKGEQVSILVLNQLIDTTTVHWHGLHVPSKWDGGPHTPILPGTVWNPTFTVLDQAATYWYHPHMHQKTAEQAIKGAAGLIIVRDSNEQSLALPRSYGIDDFPLVIQCQQYDSANQAMPLGMQDSTILVNGARANYNKEVYAEMPAQIVRLRILNASGERAFNFGFTNDFPFHIIGTDGGLLNYPVLSNRVRLGPGERVELLINLTNKIGDSLYLMSYASELAMGIQGGPTMPMPSGPPMDSPLNGIDFKIMRITVVAQTQQPILLLPNTLANNAPYTNASTTRTIRFTADNDQVMDGPFYFNDSTFDMMRIDYRIPLNQIERWKLVNNTMVAHPFHIHDVQFYLVERSGNLPAEYERGRKDVVLVPPFDSVEFITQFTDFTDSIIPYMFHCHILMHEDAGMMGQFTVESNWTGFNEPLKMAELISVYPNPANHEIKLELPTQVTQFDIKVVNMLGQSVLAKTDLGSSTINIENLKQGSYIIFIKANDAFYYSKLLID